MLKIDLVKYSGTRFICKRLFAPHEQCVCTVFLTTKRINLVYPAIYQLANQG
jgi:hypothetical protein